MRAHPLAKLSAPRFPAFPEEGLPQITWLKRRSSSRMEGACKLKAIILKGTDRLSKLWFWDAKE
jgi:hypothetical protein